MIRTRSAFVAAAVGGLALLGAPGAGRAGGLRTDGPGSIDTPPNAFACQSGPGVPIASGHLFTLDTTTGAMADLGLPTSKGASLAWDPVNARLLAWGGIGQPHGPAVGGLFDLTTPPGVLVGSAVPAGVTCGLTRDPTSGKYYLLIETDQDTALYEVNTTTAACRFIGYQWGLTASALAIDSQGHAFATDYGGEKTLYSVDLATGVLTAVGPVNIPLNGEHSCALCYDSANTLWMITGGTTSQPAKLYTVDTTTGQATAVRPLGISGWYIGLAIKP